MTPPNAKASGGGAAARQTVLFLAGARDFHAMDKFRLLSDHLGPDRVTLVTDTFQGEGQDSLVRHQDSVVPLFIIDRFMPDKLSPLGHVWRNVVKFILLPIQIRRLRSAVRRIEPSVIHAVPIYYMVLCWLSGVRYVGTPQAAEILERPTRSRVYRWFADRSLHAADCVLVDSREMQDQLASMFGITAVLMKNGFETTAALAAGGGQRNPQRVISVRGGASNYRLTDLIRARDASRRQPEIHFAYPFFEHSYLERVREMLGPHDRILGSLKKEDLYQLLGTTTLVVSLPSQDSSPRSVYEAIFCGAAVAVAPCGYLDELPECMRSRVFVVTDVEEDWLDDAMAFADAIARVPYRPSPAAIAMCDQHVLLQRIVTGVYRFDA